MSASAISRARIARRKAATVGLTLRQRGNIYQLDHSGDTVVVGGIAAVESHLAQLYTAKRPGPAQSRIPIAWEPLIAAYGLTLAAAGLSPRTVRLRRLSLAHIARGLRVAPAEVTGELLVSWFGRQTHWSLSTRKNYRASARGFFAWAYKAGHIPTYLADDLPKVRDSPPMPRPVPDRVWLDALAGADARVRLMLRLAGEAGLRRAEVARVHTRDLIDNPSGSGLLVHGKGNKRRVVPISDSLADLVRAGARGHTPWLPARGYLFPADIAATDRHLSPEHVGILVGRLMPEGYSMHKLRHRFATRAYRGSRNLRAVQTLLGHASIATTELYTAVDDDEVRAAMMAAALDSDPTHEQTSATDSGNQS